MSPSGNRFVASSIACCDPWRTLLENQNGALTDLFVENNDPIERIANQKEAIADQKERVRDQLIEVPDQHEGVAD